MPVSLPEGAINDLLDKVHARIPPAYVAGVGLAAYSVYLFLTRDYARAVEVLLAGLGVSGLYHAIPDDPPALPVPPVAPPVQPDVKS